MGKPTKKMIDTFKFVDTFLKKNKKEIEEMERPIKDFFKKTSLEIEIAKQKALEEIECEWNKKLFESVMFEENKEVRQYDNIVEELICINNDEIEERFDKYVSYLLVSPMTEFEWYEKTALSNKERNIFIYDKFGEQFDIGAMFSLKFIEVYKRIGVK